MVSKAEQLLVRALRPILADIQIGSPVPYLDGLREVLHPLEYFITEILVEIYPEWKGEGLDGVMPASAHKSGDAEVEIFGQCILISDQTMAPFRLQLQLAPSIDEVSWLECRLGEAGPDGKMIRTNCSFNRGYKHRYSLEEHADQIQWVYKATFGRRRGPSDC